MLHLYFLSVGPVLDPVVSGCCSPPVAVVRGSSGCRSRLSGCRSINSSGGCRLITPVAVVQSTPPVAVVQSLWWLLFQWPVAVVRSTPLVAVVRCSIDSGCRSSPSSAVDRLQWLSFDRLRLSFRWLRGVDRLQKRRSSGSSGCRSIDSGCRSSGSTSAVD